MDGLYSVDDGRLRFGPHDGQKEAWAADERHVVVCAGTQGGKTEFGPFWLYREMQRKGPGDYLVVSPTFPLLELKTLKAFKTLFEKILRLGRYVASPVRRFTLSATGSRRLWPNWDGSTETVVYFGHGQDPDALESATAKAAWLDECGQRKFKLESYEAILRRLSIFRGRILYTTTPYNLGWFYQQVVQRAKHDATYKVVRFASTQNPAFPAEELEEMRGKLPDWKFRMFYLAIFERPAGLIYGSFKDDICKIPRFAIPPEWPRYLGLDFGGVNMVGNFYALDPDTEYYYLYRTYAGSGLTAAEHVEGLLLEGDPHPVSTFGGAPSEDQWRLEFTTAGLHVSAPPISEVEVGISRVIGAHKRNGIYVFDDLGGYLDEKLTYARKLDEKGEPTEDIQDKNKFHYMDAERYIFSYIEQFRGSGESASVPPEDPLEDMDW